MTSFLYRWMVKQEFRLVNLSYLAFASFCIRSQVGYFTCHSGTVNIWFRFIALLKWGTRIPTSFPIMSVRRFVLLFSASCPISVVIWDIITTSVIYMRGANFSVSQVVDGAALHTAPSYFLTIQVSGFRWLEYWSSGFSKESEGLEDLKQ